MEIGASSGDEINRDINNMQETTKDKDSGHYNTFVESGVLALATKEGREKFKENLETIELKVDTIVYILNKDKGIIDIILEKEEKGYSLTEKEKVILDEYNEQVKEFYLYDTKEIEELKKGLDENLIISINEKRKKKIKNLYTRLWMGKK